VCSSDLKPFADAIREQNAAANAEAANADGTIAPETLPASNPAVEQLENPPAGNVG
jgi:hypothetical protein